MPTASGSDDVSLRAPMYARLAAPMNALVLGKPFRDAIGGIAAKADLNVWVDRMVDPTEPLQIEGPVGPTVYSAIDMIAQERDCVIMPVHNVLLVGRPNWVDQTASSLLALKLAGQDTTADIRWNDLTTPQEALARCASGSAASVTSEPTMPHDLWPASAWRQLDRRVAVTLVLAQFNRRPSSTRSLLKIRSVEASGGGPYERRYQMGTAAAAIRKVMTETDPKSRVRVVDGWLKASGTAEAHRAATKVMMETGVQVVAVDPDKDPFTLNPTSTQAGGFLMKFAQTAGMKCIIRPDAIQACQKVISVEGKDVTLRFLIDQVAEKAGVVATWSDDTITISLKDN